MSFFHEAKSKLEHFVDDVKREISEIEEKVEDEFGNEKHSHTHLGRSSISQNALASLTALAVTGFKDLNAT